MAIDEDTKTSRKINQTMTFSYSFSLVPILVSLAILFVLSFAQSDIKAASLIPKICAQNRNPSVCTQILSSTPGASTADAKSLCYISINLAMANAKETLSYIESLVNQTKEADLKRRVLVDCGELYSNTIEDVGGSKKSLDENDIIAVLAAASAALDAPGDCNSFLNGQGRGAPAPPKLTAANAKAEVYFDIFLDVANELAKH